jgi:ABC-type amino acid transport substrate-binding protein
MSKLKIAVLHFLLIISVALSQAAIATSLEEIKIMTEEYPPYNYRSSNGEITGIAVDILKATYQQAGITLDTNTIQMTPWPRAYRLLKLSDKHLLFSMTRTPSRENLFKWVGPITKTKISLIAKKSSNIKISKLEDLNQYVIGGILDDIGVLLVRDLIGFNANILTTAYAKSLARMLELNRIDLWAYEENTARHFFELNNLNPNDYESIYVLSEAELYFAFGKDTDVKIIERLQNALDRVKKP